MLALTNRGAEAQPLEPPDTQIRNDVNLLLGTLGPLLFAASRAADGPLPRAALPHLKSAARAILAVTGSL